MGIISMKTLNQAFDDLSRSYDEYKTKKEEAEVAGMAEPIVVEESEDTIMEVIKAVPEESDSGVEEPIEEAAPEAEKEESPVEDVEDPSEAVEEQGEDGTVTGTTPGAGTVNVGGTEIKPQHLETPDSKLTQNLVFPTESVYSKE